MALIEGLLGLLGYTAVGGGLPVAYCYYDHVGPIRWEAYKQAQEARGEIIELAHFLERDPIPPGKNFASHPLLEELFKPAQPGPQPREPEVFKLKIDNIDGLGRSTERGQFGWPAAQPRDLGAFVPEGIAPRDRANHILKCLGPHRKTLASIASAAARPEARFPVAWEKTFAAAVPHYSALQAITLTLSLGGSASLREGDPGNALLNLVTGIRIANHLQDDPSLIGFLVQISLRKIAYQLLWDGLRARSWDDDDLLRIDRLLQEVDIGAAYLHTLRGERAMMTQGVIDFSEGRFADPGALGEARAISLLPRGLWYENALALCVLFDGGFFSQEPFPGSVIPQYNDAFVSDRLETWKKFYRPDRVVAMVAFPALGSITDKALQAEAHLRLGRVAIALERYRLKNRRFPDELQTLVPEFLDVLPVDPVSGEALRYSLRPDQSPAIWCVGIDAKDNDGRPKKRAKYGDWVWQYQLPEGYTVDDFRSNKPLE